VSNAAANFIDKNVGNTKAVSVTGIAASGADAGNYTVNASAATIADITPRALTGNITAANKVYDGDTSATILTRTLSAPVASDSVSYSGGMGLFDDKNVGTAKTVTGTGLSLSGTDAGNYTVNTSANTIADITPLALPDATPPDVTPPIVTSPVVMPPPDVAPPVVTPPVVTPPDVTPPPDVAPPVVTPPVVTPPPDVAPPVVTPPVVTPPAVTPPVVTPPVVTPPDVAPPVVSPPVATPPDVTLSVETTPAETPSAPLSVQMLPALGFSLVVGVPWLTVLAGGIRMPLPPATAVLADTYVPPAYPRKQDRY
jgi:hypothetical protein